MDVIFFFQKWMSNMNQNVEVNGAHIPVFSSRSCRDGAEEWDNLGFGLTTKDTNMVAGASGLPGLYRDG